MALQLNSESCDTVCEAFMKRYFMDSFSKKANAYNPTATTIPQRQVAEGSYYGKALNKIAVYRRRVFKPKQSNERRKDRIGWQRSYAKAVYDALFRAKLWI